MDNTIEVKREGGTTSKIIFDKAFETLNKLCNENRVTVITDKNVYKHYKTQIDKYNHIVIGTGEENKTLETVSKIYSHLLDAGVDRKSFMVGIGGGIVTDITGFVASTYMRGVGFGFVATTLLAQVDASVGGKNGVNFDGYKNIVGCFNQPDFVICDTATLRTLPEREVRAGLAEIIKAGLLADDKLFKIFETYNYSDYTGDDTLLCTLIRRSVEIKAAVVECDFREGGERKKLNLGHTFAHAIEKCSRKYLHGEAVAIGLIKTAEVSVALGTLSESDAELIKEAITRAGLPTTCDISNTELLKALRSDKKKDRDSIDFIILTAIGHAEVRKIKFNELEALFNA